MPKITEGPQDEFFNEVEGVDDPVVVVGHGLLKRLQPPHAGESRINLWMGDAFKSCAGNVSIEAENTKPPDQRAALN